MCDVDLYYFVHVLFVLRAPCWITHQDQRSASGGGSEIYVESLRGRVQSATVKVQKVAEYLTELDKVKQHERAKIRDAERLIKHTETKEQEHQQVLVNAQAEVRACMPVFCAISAPGWQHFCMFFLCVARSLP